jgi:predicted O-methyltransferase YrrM
MAARMSHPALSPLPKGWFHHGEQILALLEQHRPAVVVELGTHYGASAIAMARVLRAWEGTLYCVDTWYGMPRPGRPRAPIKLAACAQNLIIADVNASIRLIVAETLAAGRAWQGPPIDCLYVDADHTEAGCYGDLVAWGAHVRSGGLLLGDDCDHAKYPGVRIAWERYAAEIGMALTFGAPHDTNPPGMRLVSGIKP